MTATISIVQSLLSKTDKEYRNHVKDNPPCHPERSGADEREGERDSPNRRAVEPRRGASRRDLRYSEALHPKSALTKKHPYTLPFVKVLEGS